MNQHDQEARKHAHIIQKAIRFIYFKFSVYAKELKVSALHYCPHHSSIYSFVFGNAVILNRAAPMGMSVISSLSPLAASSSGNTPHNPVSSISHSGTNRPTAFTSKGTLATVKGSRQPAMIYGLPRSASRVLSCPTPANNSTRCRDISQ